MTTTIIKGLIFTFWVAVMAFLMPIQHYLVITIILVVTDLITGVRAAKKRGESIRSRGFRRTVEKIAMYSLGILMSHGVDLVFFAPAGFSFGMVWIVAGVIGLTEFKSNLENIAVVTGVDLWEQIASKIPSVILPKRKD